MSEVIDAAIAELERKREDLDSAIASLRRVVGYEPTAEKQAETAAKDPGHSPTVAPGSTNGDRAEPTTLHARAGGSAKDPIPYVQDTRAGHTTKLPRPSKGTLRDSGVKARVLAWLNEHPDQPWRPEHIGQALKLPVPKRGMAACVQLLKAGKITRPGYGQYQALRPNGNGHARDSVTRVKTGLASAEATGSPALVRRRHDIWRDGSILKCRHCPEKQVREDAFSPVCA